MIARAGALATLAAITVTPLQAAQPSVRIENAWVRPANPGQPATPLYADITSDAPLALVGASSDIAKGAAIFAGERAIAKPMASLEVPAGAKLRLAPRGTFVELQQTTQLVRTGASVPFTLEFKTADGEPLRVNATAVVRGIMARPTESADGSSDAATIPSTDGVPMPSIGR